MDMIPIKLGLARPVGKAKAIKPKQGGAGSSGAASLPSGPGSITKNLPAELREKIFKRDDYTCRCCGFKAKKYQEITFLDGNIHHHHPRNMATTCIFCHQCFNLDQVHTMRSGVLLWLPEIEQTQLHHIARAIYVARISQGAAADAARKALDVLMNRREEVKRRIGIDDPYILSMVMSDYLNDKAYHMRGQKLDGIRLFPLDRRIIKEAALEFNQFPQILAYWRSKDGPFGGKTPQNWLGIYQQYALNSGDNGGNDSNEDKQAAAS